ncbi:MAG: methyltransferase [Alphaproteobacteria bacterium]
MSIESAGTPGAGPLLVRVGNFLFRYRNYAFPMLLLPLLLVFPPQYPLGSARLDRWLDAAALVVAFLGEGLRVAVVGLAYIKRGGVGKRVYAERLVVEGLFAHCRNPLYVGNAMLLLALLMLVNNPWVYLIGGSFFLFAYTAIVAAEESYLKKKFGAEYEDYCRRVNRWVPDPRGIAETVRGMTFNWRRVAIKEYSSVYAWVLVAVILQADETVRNVGPEARGPALAALAAVFVLSTAAFIGVYVLKKSRILVDRPSSPA